MSTASINGHWAWQACGSAWVRPRFFSTRSGTLRLRCKRSPQ
ncbi:hypothetical protein ACOI9X_11355 [Pseudomonas sp. P2757]